MRVGEDRCPACGHRLTHATGISTDSPPEPGDLSVCIRCAAVLIFGPDMVLEKFTGKLDAETTREITKAQNAVRSVQAN